MQAVEPMPGPGVLGIFVEPARALRWIEDAPLPVRSLLLFGAGALAFGGVLHAVVSHSVRAGLEYGLSATVHLLIDWAIFAAFLYAVGLVLHHERAWPLAARLSALLNALTALAICTSSLIGLVIGLSGNAAAPDQGLIPSPAMLFAAGSFPAHFAYGFNVMSLWFYGLVGLALVRVYAMKPGAAAALVLAFVIVLSGCLAAVS